MSIRRYNRSSVIMGGRATSTGVAGIAIYQAVKSGAIDATKRQIKQGERLDIIAGQTYGDAGLWWIIAAASGIGWSLQVPPGVVISIPVDLGQVSLFVG